ncbi:MAG: hypothetical protein IT557_17385 [Alphaproteobacteria bacterium]|nr:hypothetical protein [Alphaproteobacteria bacterium]
MSNSNWKSGQQDAYQNKGAANTSGWSSQSKESYNAGYNAQKQSNSGGSNGGSKGGK